MADQVSLAYRVMTGPLNFWRRANARGPGYALGWLAYQFQWRWREWRLGIATREYAHDVAVFDQGECCGYEPIDYLCFDQVLAHLHPIGPEDGFLDYGCGMGRALMLAARHPWGAVVGVEMDPRLAAIARQGLAQLQRRGLQRARRAEVALTDARAYEVPPQVNCIFLFNSFGGAVLQAVLAQVRASWERQPRRIRVVYVQPAADPDPLQGVDWLVPEAELPTGYFPELRSRVYRTAATTGR